MIHSGIQASVLLVNIRIDRKNLEETNTVAYFDAVFVAKVLNMGSISLLQLQPLQTHCK
jgi:hypothetical protein